MSRVLGSLAGMLALSALLLRTIGNPSSAHEAASASERTIEKAESAQGAPLAGDQGPWQATRQYYHATSSSFQRVDQSCLLQPLAQCKRSQVLALYGVPASVPEQNTRFLIVTVPDPLHTRMALETDRSLDAIQQAAFRSGWELATEWLPWTVKVPPAEGAPSKPFLSHASDVEKLPGLLAFRPHFQPYGDINRLLLIFVVGETPTAGLNGYQFQLAQRTVALLASETPNTIYIAGPNFSGSLMSLTQLLEESPGKANFEIYSGAVSNSDYVRAMLLDLQSKGFSIDSRTSDKPSVTFHGFTLPSASFHHHFVRLVKSFGLTPAQAAELVEDETGFSFTDRKLHPDTEDFPIPTYRYPRDIAQLRNNYNDAAFGQDLARSSGSAASPLGFSLKDTQSGEDSFPIFSPSHTPISQNAELQQLVDFLNRRSVRLVSLSATNVFDTLFLANVLNRNCPDTRIVIRGPDLLFVQEASRGALSGVMAISAFPLFPEGTEWTRESTVNGPAFREVAGAGSRIATAHIPDVPPFATSDQVSEFDAVLSTLQHPSLQNRGSEPFEGSFSPDAVFSTWVLVLGANGWMPVDLYGQTNLELPLKGSPAPKPAWFDPKDAPASQPKPPALPMAGLGWTGLCLGVLIFSFAFCGRFLLLEAGSGIATWSVLSLSDLSTFNRRRAVNTIVHSRYLCMLSCFASLALVNGLFVCPMWAAHFVYGGSVAIALETLSTLAYALSLGTAVYLAFSVPARVCEEGPLGICPFPTPVSRWSLVLRGGIFALSIGGTYLWWRCCSNGMTGYFLCFRTIRLAAPVCPIWPLLLGTFGLFALSYFHLRRFTWGDQRQPQLETSVFDEALSNEFSNITNKLEQDLLRPFSITVFGGIPMALLTAILLVVCLWLLFPAESLRSFEPHIFSRLFGAILMVLGAFTFLSFLRFISCWSIFRAFLVSVNSVLLGRFFGRVPEFSGSGPVWIREVKLMSLATAVNAAIALHNLEKAFPPCSYTAEYAQKLRNLLCPPGEHPSHLEFIYAYAQFRLVGKSIAHELGEKVLRPYWHENKLPFVGESGPAEADDERSEPVAAVAAVAATSGNGPIQVRSFEAAAAYVDAVSRRVTAAPVRQEEKGLDENATAISSDAYGYAAKYVALQYSAYIGYVQHQLQNLLICSVICFVLLLGALNSYSFQAPHAMFRFLMVTLVVSSVAVLTVLAQMERDPVLSRLSGTAEGQLGKGFYIRALRYGALPVMTVLSVQFPAISRFISALIQPASGAP